VAVVVGAVVLTLAGAGYFSWRSSSPVAAPAPKVMLAVLPFENLGGEAEQAYLVDGFTEDLITELGRIHPQRLGVIARTSVMPYRGTQKTVKQIAGELGVQYILEGSVRREGGQLRITAQLIEAADQTHVWADRFDRSPDDLLRVQGEIASALGRPNEPVLPCANSNGAPVPSTSRRSSTRSSMQASANTGAPWSGWNAATRNACG
jgi:TolB-like protein